MYFLTQKLTYLFFCVKLKTWRSAYEEKIIQGITRVEEIKRY